MKENSGLEKKALITLTKPNPDWKEIAKDCVCFANGIGGSILFGIDDDQSLPPVDQKVSPDLLGKLIKNVQNNAINVGVVGDIKTATNGGQYLELRVSRSASTIASTSTGKYYIRVDDECKPLLPDELGRLFTDKQAFSWELLKSVRILRTEHDPQKLSNFISDLNNSDRVSDFVKSKSADELMDLDRFEDVKTILGAVWVNS